MTDRATCRGSVAALRFSGAPIVQALAGGATALLHAVRGGAAVSGTASGGWHVREGATLRLDDIPGALTVAGDPDGVALLAVIAPALP